MISIVLKAITKDLRSPSDNDLSVSPASSVIQAPEAGLMLRDVEKGKVGGLKKYMTAGRCCCTARKEEIR